MAADRSPRPSGTFREKRTGTCPGFEGLLTDGAEVLYHYASLSGDPQLRMLTVVHTGQRVCHEVILEYLQRIDSRDNWATGLVIPIARRELLRVRPDVVGGAPLFMNRGAPLSAVYSRYRACEPIGFIAADFEVPADEIAESMSAIWPRSEAT